MFRSCCEAYASFIFNMTTIHDIQTLCPRCRRVNALLIPI